ncbi:MAG: alpha-hydroxy-acid oxidizing protein [Lachnospiraceae bacterium]|nr:alpha-hydroxy-acid oxidizing protein [Lachnospiraceae bacterium]
MRGDSNQITRDYFDSLLLETRYIDAILPNTEYKLFGETFATPIMTAALSHLHNICDNAMVEIAKGAKDAGAVHWVGMGEPEELEAILATGAQTIKIIKPYADNEEILYRIKHAVNHGAFAVGMDIDHAFTGNGRYDCIHGLHMRPKTQTELASFVQAADAPFIIKGVLSVSDALKCAEIGVAGIVVSHHHSIMPYSIPPLQVLPDIVDAVGDQMEIFVDCGIESGIDAFKAMALGARAVCVGRDLMGPLEGGAAGVTNRILELTGELKSTMARTGMRSLDDMEPSVIWHRPI